MTRIQPDQVKKAIAYDYQAYLDGDTTCCQVCLEQRQIDLILTMMPYIGWSQRWTLNDDGDYPSLQEVSELQADMEYCLMSPCCGNETIGRYGADGIWETSTDGGCTWIDHPECDPTQNQSTFPAIPGDDNLTKRCIAATAARDFIKQQTDLITASEGAFDSITAIHDALRDQLLKTLGWAEVAITAAEPILWAWAIGLFVIGATVLEAALTTDVWDRLLCNFYCNMENDGSFTTEDVGLVRQQLLLDETGIAFTYLDTLIQVYGALGLTNAARSNPNVEADCSDCDCPFECGENLIINLGTLISQVGNVWTLETVIGGDGKQQVNFQFSADGLKCCCVNTITNPGDSTARIDCQGGGHGTELLGGLCGRAFSFYNNTPGGPSFQCTFTVNGCFNEATNECFE